MCLYAVNAEPKYWVYSHYCLGKFQIECAPETLECNQEHIISDGVGMNEPEEETHERVANTSTSSVPAILLFQNYHLPMTELYDKLVSVKWESARTTKPTFSVESI